MTHRRRLAPLHALPLLPLLLPLLLLGGAPAVRAGDAAAPPTPYLDQGACPFECCTYGNWKAEQPTPVRAEMRDDAPVAFKLRKGEKFKALTGVVITTRPGQAKVVKPTTIEGPRARVGEVLYVLTYQGEGFYKAWYRGKLVKDIDFTGDNLKVTTKPESVWWVKVRNSKGQVGWTQDTDHFGGNDAC